MRIKIYQPLAIHELGKRVNQEDSIYPIEGKATENDRLFLLCDGMGGHEHGEVASQSICKSLSSFLLQHAVASEGLEDKLLSDALAYAYEELDKLAIAGDTRQMGTTLTLLYFHGNGCTAAHIGDSRIYHLRPSSHTILYKSRDHSLVYDLYQAGELTYEEMKTFPQKNVITRAMIAGDRNHPKLMLSIFQIFSQVITSTFVLTACWNRWRMRSCWMSSLRMFVMKRSDRC